jgi:hypothetical protein
MEKEIRQKLANVLGFKDLITVDSPLLDMSGNRIAVNPYPQMFWIVATSYFNAFPNHMNTEEYHPIYQPRRGYIYFLVVHAKMWSKAAIYYEGMDHLLEPLAERRYPFAVDFRQEQDEFQKNLTSINFTFAEQYWAISEVYIPERAMTVNLSARGIEGTFYCDIPRETKDLQMRKLWNGFILTAVAIAQQYDDPRLISMISSEHSLFDLSDS